MATRKTRHPRRKPMQPKAAVPAAVLPNKPADPVAPLPTTRAAWLRQQFGLTALMKVTLTLGILGFIPGAWMIGVPVLSIYGLVKREKVAAALHRFFSFHAEGQPRNVANTLGDQTAEFLMTYYPGILRWAATLSMFFTMPIFFGLLASYGLLRFTTNEWLDIFQRRCRDLYQFTLSSINRFVRDTTLRSKIILGSAVGIMLGLSVLLSGIGIFIAYSILVCQLAAVLVGTTAIARDLREAYLNPGKSLTNNAGKAAGTFWGYSLAYRLFPGHVTGSMGPAVGQVHSYGLFSSLFSSLSPQGWFVFNSGGILGVIFSRIMSFANSIFFNVFVNGSMQIQGDFFGTIGPSPVQLIIMMAVGCLIGYGVEKFVDSLCDEASEDGKKLAIRGKDGARVINNRLLDALYRSRWALGFIVGTTPLMMTSSTISAVLFELAGGSLIGASAITVTGLAAAIGAVYGIGYGVKSLADSIRARQAIAPAQQTPHAANTPAKAAAPKTTAPKKTDPAPLVPGFERAKGQAAHKQKQGSVPPVEPAVRRSPRLLQAKAR